MLSVCSFNFIVTELWMGTLAQWPVSRAAIGEEFGMPQHTTMQLKHSYNVLPAAMSGEQLWHATKLSTASIAKLSRHSAAVSVGVSFQLHRSVSVVDETWQANYIKHSCPSFAMGRLHCYIIYSVAQLCNFCLKRTCSYDLARSLVECEFAVE